MEEKEKSNNDSMDAEEREKRQEKHYQLFKELQSMSSELPIKYQQRLPYELLSDLANCLIEDTVGLIVKGLADIQKITEQTLYEKRQKTADALKLRRVELVKRLKEDQSVGLIASEQGSRIIREYDRKSAEELHRFDIKTVMDLDQVVSEQQVTLEKTGVPGFHVTNNPVEIQLQMYIIDFIIRLSEKKSDQEDDN